MSLGTPCVTALLLLSAICANAAQLPQTGSVTIAVTSPPGQTMDMSEVVSLLQQQQQDLARQGQLLEAQSQEIVGLKRELNVLQSRSTSISEQTISRTENPAGSLTSQSKSKAELEAQTSKSVATAQIDDPTRVQLTDFKGACAHPAQTRA